MNKPQLYAALQPPSPTPQSELCACDVSTPIKLMTALGYNLIHCVKCNLEVPLERLNLTEDVVEVLAQWRSLYEAAYRLWLDSEDYGQWACRQLSDIHSRINVLGLDARGVLNTIQRCYYWYFQDEAVADYTPFTSYPVCGQDLQEFRGSLFNQRVCETCGIIGAGE